MQQKIDAKNYSDPNPTGGTVDGIGLKIEWQNGPLGRDGERKEPNGTFVETVIKAALQRIDFYQTSCQIPGPNGVMIGKFACRENAIAIMKLEEALLWLNKRTQDRENRKVEGTHKV